MKFWNFRKASLSQQLFFTSMGTISAILIGVSTYMISASISAKVEQLQIMANGQSSAVIEKIDRNFYERFGDVQAFAFNQLAVHAARTSSSSDELQRFINTMVSYYVLYDLMIVCDRSGKVLAANTIDKSGKTINSDMLIRKDFSGAEWFLASVSGSGPEGGAWYSDFTENKDVSEIYGRPGLGMGFAAPIRDSTAAAIGVWYNFASWESVTTEIRKETETSIRQSQPEAIVMLTNAGNKVIDSDDPELMLTSEISSESFSKGTRFEYLGQTIGINDFVIGSKLGTGAYTYKGKSWKAITLIPRTKFSFTYITQNLLGFMAIILTVLVGTGIAFLRLSSSISKSINLIKTDIEFIAKGELVDVKESRMQNEIGAMTSALGTLVSGMRNTAQFAEEIGKGNLEISFSALSDKDVIGHSLITMRNNLVKIKVEDQTRSWMTNGLAKIGEILRANYDNAEALYDHVIRFVVKYSSATQGGIFLQQEAPNEKELSLVACYAYERKKFLKKTIAIGEGLVGQCFLEQEMIYMTVVPNDYVAITSGLGEAPPSSVIILPLKTNDTLVGILELASLKPFPEHVRELLQKFSESIASTISSVRISERTKKLLAESQQQADVMRSQEEEMRQNLEELSATQEEISRKEGEYVKRIKELEKELEAAKG
jgi:methyl-accepting chemotaxis protein